MNWRCSNSLIVVCLLSVSDNTPCRGTLTSIVHEDSSEVANDVDDEEDSAIFAPHRQIASTSIARNGCRRRKLLQTIVNSFRRAEPITSGISRERESEKDDEEDDGVDVVCEEGGFDPTKHSVDYDTQRK